MHANSREVSSTQSGVHPDLRRLVRRHMDSPWRAPAHSLTPAVRSVLADALERGRPVVLDSFCGTGHSTRLLARNHPDCTVIGVDKSISRLARHGDTGSGNYLLVRARCEDVWGWLAERHTRLRAHYLLYPNPWPKRGHLKRRVHGHPAFPLLLRLGGWLEMRCNWQVFAEEFGIALATAGQFPVVCALPMGEPLSLFERKYRDSGHTLWRCTAQVTRQGE